MLVKMTMKTIMMATVMVAMMVLELAVVKAVVVVVVVVLVVVVAIVVVVKCLDYQTAGCVGSVLGLVGPVSVCYYWVRQQV